MNFQCKLCTNEYFASNKEAVVHLKKNHGVKEKRDQIGCTVKNSKCGKFFHTFQGLSRHISTCSIQLETETVNEAEKQLECSNDSVNISEIIAKLQDSYIFEGSEVENDLSSMGDSNLVNNTFICEEVAAEGGEPSFSFDLSTAVTCDEITKNYLMGLLSLNINEKTMNDMFRLTGTLLENTHRFCQQSMAENDPSSIESLNCSMKLICNDLQKFDSSYKRKQFIESQPSFVEPIQLGIGTHFENERDPNSHFRTPVRKQSLFSMISPLEIIEKLFEKPHFRETYFEYNQKTKHICEPNVYRDFCCGSVYKKTELFKKYPNSLQLQFFVDGFEVCNPLKSKTGLHSQVAVYMTIRNMPPQFAHSMNNIFLICLVNENDLKKAETNYTNILEQIVKEIRILETIGIDIGNDVFLRGDFFLTRLFVYFDLFTRCFPIFFFQRHDRQYDFR